MQAGNFDFAGVHSFEDAGHHTDACAVAQFGKFKAQVANLSQHGSPIGMPMGIPTTGKGIHRASDWNGDLRLGIWAKLLTRVLRCSMIQPTRTAMKTPRGTGHS